MTSPSLTLASLRGLRGVYARGASQIDDLKAKFWSVWVCRELFIRDGSLAGHALLIHMSYM